MYSVVPVGGAATDNLKFEDAVVEARKLISRGIRVSLTDSKGHRCRMWNHEKSEETVEEKKTSTARYVRHFSISNLLLKCR